MLLLSYLFGISSKRRLVREIQVNVAYRWFLRMGLTEKVPVASTLSQNRIRRFNGSDVVRQIFDHIVEQALARGMANSNAQLPYSASYRFCTTLLTIKTVKKAKITGVIMITMINELTVEPKILNEFVIAARR